jgi:cysteine synthase A
MTWSWSGRPLLTAPPVGIGDTPSWRLAAKMSGLTHQIYLKDESANPFGSIKDRVAWGMIAAAINVGRIGRGSHIVEASSGNTGLAVAALGKLLDLEVTIVTGLSIAPGHRALIEAAGARLIVTGNTHSERIDEARRIASERGAFFLNQYENLANPLTHRDWTAPEVFAQNPDCTAVFACASSGGTAAGFSMYRSQSIPQTALFVVDPGSSSVLAPNAGASSPIHIAGFGSEAPSNFARYLTAAEVIRISEIEAFGTQRAMAQELGVDLGFSSGGVISGALSWLDRQSEPQRVVCICPDAGQRYASAAFATDVLCRSFPTLRTAIAARAEALHQSIVSVERIPFEPRVEAAAKVVRALGG